MAFTLVSNPTAISGQGAIRSANNNLSNTIKQLSTGLRINSSADDASGLAVSEKLRGQISGLTVASRNAQDAISYLQTAEAAMGTMINMVQRVRELGVQAGDPAYTSNDRVILQTEVNELLDEINRVSDSAEFNTKKLLNGDGAALWSGTQGIEALVHGSTVSGNYNVETTMDPGKNNIYKTNIMSIGAGQISYDVVDAGGGIGRLSDIKNVLTDSTKDVDIAVGAVTAVITGAADSTIFENSLGMTGNFDAFSGGATYNIEIEALKEVELTDDVAVATTTKDALRFRVTNIVTGEVSGWYNADVIDGIDAAPFTIKGNGKVADAFNSVGLTDVNAHSILSGGTTIPKDISVKGRTSVVKTDNLSAAYNGGATLGTLAGSIMGSYGSVATGMTGSNIGTHVYGGAVSIEFEATEDKVLGGGSGLRYRVTNLADGNQSGWHTLSVNADGSTTISAGGSVGTAALNEVGLSGALMHNATATAAAPVIVSNAFEKGDKFLIGTQGNVYFDGKTIADITDIGKVAGVSIGDGPEVIYKDAIDVNNAAKVNINTAQMDDAGKVHYGSFVLELAKGTSVVPGVTTVNFLGEGEPASLYTELRQISSFTNADGRMLLDNTRELTIYGNNKDTTISLEGSDTIADLETKFSNAIIEALDLGSAGVGVNNNLVKFIGKDEKTDGSDRAVKGTFVIQGAAIGDDSELYFSSDQGILGALGIAKIQDGTGSTITATVKNAHTNAFIGRDTVTDGVVRGILDNVDIKLDQSIGSTAIWDDVLQKLTFRPDSLKTSTLHLVNNPTVAAIGANEGQLLDISIGRIDTTTLNMENISVISINDAQSAITKADQALDSINQTRAVLGAQMNRLDYTISNLDVARENMSIADSRIRELDIAEASTRLASEQTILQAASAMLAQANQLPSYAMQLLQ